MRGFLPDGTGRIFHGEIINTKDVITFQVKTLAESETVSNESIDEYIGWCIEEGVKPEKPYSGKFNLRLSPECCNDTDLDSIDNSSDVAVSENVNIRQLPSLFTYEITAVNINNKKEPLVSS